MGENNDLHHSVLNAKRHGTVQRRQQIVEAAVQLIGVAGLDGLNISAIAKAIQLVPSAIYRHFSGKEEILDAVSDLIGTRLLNNVQRVHHDPGDALTKLHQLLQLHIAMVKSHPGIARYVFAVDGSNGHPQRQQRLYQAIQGYLLKIAAIIEQGQASGCIRRQFEAETLCFMFLGLLQPAIFLNHLSGGQFNIEEHSERAWQVYRAMLTGAEC